MNISGVMVSIGAMGVLVGITIMLFDPTNKLIGGIIALLGLALCIGSYFKVIADENKKRSIMARMVSGIETMGQNINTLIEEIRKDRKNPPRQE